MTTRQNGLRPAEAPFARRARWPGIGSARGHDAGVFTGLFRSKGALMKRLLLVVASLGLTASVAVPAAQDSPEVVAGRAVFAQKKCVMCHLAEGKGNKKYTLHGLAAKMSDADIRKWLTAPADMEKKLKAPPKPSMSSKMTALKAAEVDALVAYIKSLK
jgi:cytochrome c